MARQKKENQRFPYAETIEEIQALGDLHGGLITREGVAVALDIDATTVGLLERRGKLDGRRFKQHRESIPGLITTRKPGRTHEEAFIFCDSVVAYAKANGRPFNQHLLHLHNANNEEPVSFHDAHRFPYLPSNEEIRKLQDDGIRLMSPGGVASMLRVRREHLGFYEERGLIRGWRVKERAQFLNNLLSGKPLLTPHEEVFIDYDSVLEYLASREKQPG